MRFVDMIEKKAGGQRLSSAEIAEMVTGYVAGEIPDYQMSAMLMAILQRGMTAEETAELTLSMMHSGDVVDLSDLPGVKLDKHSTGGVGDTTTLVVAPLVAACGGTVAKMSGRGLGHTGGTLDKLESIPGCCVEQSMESFRRIVRENGVAVIGQTGNLVPADKKIYALRDVTATVRSVPLIASSVMSKKLASGSDAIVLDVKTGTGAFMETPEEAVQLFSGQIAPDDPLYEVCMLLGSQMLRMGGLAADDADARNRLRAAIDSGAGLEKLQRMVAMMGGESAYLTPERIDELCAVRLHIDVPAGEDGCIVSMQAERIGTAAQMLGAGRATKEDVIDPAVGLVMRVRCGDTVRRGDPLCTLYVNDETRVEEAKALLLGAIRIGAHGGAATPMVYGVVESK